MFKTVVVFGVQVNTVVWFAVNINVGMAAVSVVRHLMPAVTHRLCFFHFCQENYRYAKEH